MRLFYGTLSERKRVPLSADVTYSADTLQEMCRSLTNKHHYCSFYVDFEGEFLKLEPEDIKIVSLLCAVYHHKTQEENLQVKFE